MEVVVAVHGAHLGLGEGVEADDALLVQARARARARARSFPWHFV